jgi:ubiquinone biosynthesis protein
MPFAEVEEILDREVPRWRKDLRVSRYPLGVASLAQVHAADDAEGRQWVIKIVKPRAQKRLLQTVEAMEAAAAAVEPFAVTLVAKRSLRELRELCLGFRRELSLDLERETIERVAEKLKARRQRALLIPEVNAPFCTANVLTVERFQGVSLSDVVSGKVEVSAALRQKLAKSMLSELLVQVFELGLFHADPHAGNLILMESGSVGLFDWGLAGELSEGDRRHIAAILRSVIGLDLDQLVDALIVMGSEAGRQLTPEEVRKELKVVTNLIKKGREDPTRKPSLQQLFEACLRSAGKLGIEVPEGLLLMVKSLITIEGLAKGIDPAISMARIATPVLLKAAKPGFREIIAMGRRLPQVAKLVFGRS